jgi:hypothetical protein
MSCGGHPNAEVFAHHYELHYQNKEVHLEGSKTTFAAQFECISFHPSQFVNHSRLTQATWNKWTTSWHSHWFYCKVPSEQGNDFPGQKTYLLGSQMTRLNDETDVFSSCGPKDTNFIAFVDET